ncbi:MAG: glycosyltransferase family 2 protein [Pseudobutyrivibrio sp.]|nr:glycosyltransferase family 2 protein [Pseudobutyrivibrio sp.]
MISVVVPCYNEQEALPAFYEEYKKMTSQIPSETFELLLVNDGSKDNTLEVMMDLAARDSEVKYISFSRNFGKEGAIFAGLENSSGDYVVMMDADLQDPPSMLPEMYRAVTEEGYDSVATRRVTRKGEPPIRSFFARRFYSIINRISDTEIVDGARDYRLMNRKFVDALLSLGEYNRFSKGLFGWVGFKTKWLEYENVERVAGETKWSFWKLFAYAIEGIVAFSTAPLQVSALLGVIMSFIAFVAIIFIVVRKLVCGDPVAGWASLASIIVFVGGIQMFFIGVLGEYLAKAYLEIKDRPKYIIDKKNF